MRRLTISSFLLFVMAGSLALPARAQQGYDPDYGDEEAIQQTVARVAYFTGSVSYSRGDDPDNWQAAGLNFPMTLGDRVYTGRDSRLVLQMTGASVYLAPNTDLAALNLTSAVRQLSISEGLVSFSVRGLGPDDSFEVDTPNASITFDRPGEYRIDVTGSTTRVSAWSGSATVAAGGGEVFLRAGDLIEIDGLDRPTYDVYRIPRRDSWDAWVESRARRLRASASVRYVHDDVLGAEDLDDYGRWDNLPEYGRCWSPRSVSSDWAPYRDGRWAWQDPWGWSWVSNEPWGFAPYHWGRWINYRARWFWVPVGRATRSAPYSPALVAFVGTGAGWSGSLSFGSGGQIGWFPLAPHEPFAPWWGASRRGDQVNVRNATYRNRTYITVVNQNTFVSGGAVAPYAIRDAAVIRQMALAPISRGHIPFIPVASSLRVSAAAAPSGLQRPSDTVLRKPVVTRLAPPPAPPSFQTKAPHIRENRGEPIAPGVAIRLDDQRGGGKPVQPVRPVVTEPGRVSLTPRKESVPAPAPAAVSAPHGRPFATTDRPTSTEQPRRREAPGSEVSPQPPAARPDAPERRDEPRPAMRAVEQPPAPPGREAPRAVDQPKGKPDDKRDKDKPKDDKKDDGKDN